MTHIQGFGTTVSHLLSDGLDIFTLLNALVHQNHPGVRDHLVNRLYDIADADIDFVLPQLCALFISWSPSQSNRLIHFLTSKCSQSIHLSLKLIWLLQAQAFYHDKLEKQNRIKELIQKCEMSLVNASIFGEKEIMNNNNVDEEFHSSTDNRKRNTRRMQLQRARLHALNSKYYADLTSTTTNSSAIISSSADASQPAIDTNTTTVFSPYSPPSSSISDNSTPSKDCPCKNELISISDKHYGQTPQISDSNVSYDSSISPPPLLPQGSLSSLPISIEEIFFALSKQVKSEYFNAEMRLIHHLIDISNHIVKFPSVKRKKVLRRMLSNFHPVNLYFPSNKPNSPHYKIIRLLPNECISLNSRDKAPFMLYAEIEYRDTSVYSYDIYTAMKSNESIMKEAIQLEKEEKSYTQACDEPEKLNEYHSSTINSDSISPSPPSELNSERVRRSSHEETVESILSQAEKRQHQALQITLDQIDKEATKNLSQSRNNNTTHLSNITSNSNNSNINNHPADALAQVAIEERKENQHQSFDKSIKENSESSIASRSADLHYGRNITNNNRNLHNSSGNSMVIQIDTHTSLPSTQSFNISEPPSPVLSTTSTLSSSSSSPPSASSPLPGHIQSLSDLIDNDYFSGSPTTKNECVLRHSSSGNNLGIVRVHSSTSLLRSPSAPGHSSHQNNNQNNLKPTSSKSLSYHQSALPHLVITPSSNPHYNINNNAENGFHSQSTPTSPISRHRSISQTSPYPSSMKQEYVDIQEIKSAIEKKTHHVSMSSGIGVDRLNNDSSSPIKRKDRSTIGSDFLSLEHLSGEKVRRRKNSWLDAKSSHSTPSSNTIKSISPHSADQLEPTSPLSNSASNQLYIPQMLSSLPSPVDVDYQSSPSWLKLDSSFGDSWLDRKKRISLNNPNAINNPKWDVLSAIFKNGDDCRQEVLAMQIIHLFHHIWQEAHLPLYLRPYSVLLTGAHSGLIETIPDSTSIDSLKKSQLPSLITLAGFFESYFRPQGEARYQAAMRNYIESIAGYSVVTYLLQIKDRHNGNIMLDREGHLIHIDYGFMLSNSPGGNWNFESSPFKLTAEYIEVMGGDSSPHFQYFKLLVISGYLESRKHSHIICLLIEMLQNEGKMPCFSGSGPAGTLKELKDRFQLDTTEKECIAHVNHLIELSIDNWRSVQYDLYQRTTNNIN